MLLSRGLYVNIKKVLINKYYARSTFHIGSHAHDSLPLLSATLSYVYFSISLPFFILNHSGEFHFRPCFN